MIGQGTDALKTIRARVEERADNFDALNPWLTKALGGSGVLGAVVYLTSVRYRGPVVRDFYSLRIPAGVTIHAAHALSYRSTTTVVVDGCIDGSGAAEKPEGRSHGSRAPAARISRTTGGDGFRVSCRACYRIHMTADETTLREWSIFALGFGGEVFLCPCGVESELRFD